MAAPPDFSRAACIGHEELFTDSRNTRAVVSAKRICKTCPILNACRDWSLRFKDHHGVLGGMDEAERRERVGEPPTAQDLDRAWVIEEVRVRGIQAVALDLHTTPKALERRWYRYRKDAA